MTCTHDDADNCTNSSNERLFSNNFNQNEFEQQILECTPVVEDEEDFDEDSFSEEEEDERENFLSRPKRMADSQQSEEDSGSADEEEDEDSKESSKSKEGMVSVPVLDGCHSIHQMGVKKSGYHWIKTGPV